MNVVRNCLVPVLLVAAAAAQQPSSQGAPESAAPAAVEANTGVLLSGASSQAEANPPEPQIPLLFAGPGRGLTLAPELQRASYLRGGINLSSGYNDNALLEPRGGSGDTTVSIYPSLALNHSTTRMNLLASYGAGFTLHQPLSAFNQASHSFDLDSTFRLSPHVTLHTAQNLLLTAGGFAANPESGLAAGSSGAGVITPLADQRSLKTAADASYHLARNDIVAAGGSFYDLHFSQISTGAGTLTDTRTVSGFTTWMHQTFPGNWTGVAYQFARIDFGGNGQTVAHTLALTDTWAISKRLRISGFLGPEYADNRGAAPATASSAGWTSTGGVEAQWQTERTGLSAGFSKRISDGGGLLGAAGLKNVYGSASRQLSPGWKATLSANYAASTALALSPATTATDLHTTSLGISFERRPLRNLGVQFGYFRDLQDQSGAPAVAQNYSASQNRFFLTLSYLWTKPLGR